VYIHSYISYHPYMPCTFSSTVQSVCVLLVDVERATRGGPGGGVCLGQARTCHHPGLPRTGRDRGRRGPTNKLLGREAGAQSRGPEVENCPNREVRKQRSQGMIPKKKNKICQPIRRRGGNGARIFARPVVCWAAAPSAWPRLSYAQRAVTWPAPLHPAPGTAGRMDALPWGCLCFGGCVVWDGVG